MNCIDIIVLVPLIWFAIKGFRNGLIKELASLLAIVGGGWLAVKYTPILSAYYGGTLTANIVTFIVLFFLVLIAVHFLAVFVAKIIKLLIPNILDNLLGLCFGALKVLLAFSLCCIFIERTDTEKKFIKQDSRDSSQFYKYIEPKAELFQQKKHDISGTKMP